MLRGKTILITGGSGAIGSNLCKQLAQDNQIIVLDNLSSGYAFNLQGIDNLKFVEGSILNKKRLKESFLDKPGIVFHLAANFANQNSVDHPVKDLEVNGLGTLKLLEASRLAHIEKFVFASSSCVYGNLEEDMKETSPLTLDTPYSITKLLGEHYVRFYDGFHGLNTTTLRFFNSYGPGEMPGKYRNVIPNFMASALNGEPLFITGTGEETRAFTFVEDVVEAIIKSAVRKEARRQVINVGNAQTCSIIDLVKIIISSTRSSSVVKFTAKRAWDHISHRRPSTQKAKTLLDWEAKTPLSKGIQRYYEWLSVHLPKFRSGY